MHLLCKAGLCEVCVAYVTNEGSCACTSSARRGCVRCVLHM